MRILYPLFILLFLSACQSFYPAAKNKMSPQWSTLELEPFVEPYELRIDLIRQKDETSNGQTMSSSDRSYHPLAVNLGNGLILDRSMNLGLSVLELFDIRPDTDFTIYRESVRFSGTPTRIYNREGSHFETYQEALLPDRQKVDYTDSTIQITSFLSRETIRQEDNVWVRKSFLINDKMVKLPDTICFRPLWRQCLTYQPGLVSMKRNFSVREGAQGWSILLNHQRWSLYRVGESFYFVNNRQRGYRITRDNNIIWVESNGRLLWKYTLVHRANNIL